MRKYSPIEKILIILPFLFILLELSFGVLNPSSNKDISLCLFLAAWMVSWWVFEILPLGVTALIPLFFLPFFQIMPLKAVSPAYSNPVIFLFLGGFIIARALEKTKLDERIALNILACTGKSDFGIVIGFTIATAFLSMWISNTATTVMMVPIALSVVHFLKTNIQTENKSSIDSLAIVLFLSIAYSANIGGITTPVGTPPNVVLLGYLEDLYSHKIDFSSWLLATTPVAVTLLFIMLLLLKKLFPFKVPIPENFHSFLSVKISSLGKFNTPQ
ncbi:MAG: SLC13 family permease, partial [Bdellovibrionales bacterium]